MQFRIAFVFTIFYFLIILMVSAQSQFYWENDPVQDNRRMVMKIPELEQSFTRITLQESQSNLSRVYLVTDNNLTLSSSYIPSQNYQFKHPCNPSLKYIFGKGDADFLRRDSFNPFGVYRIQDALVLGVVNTLFSKFMRNTKKYNKAMQKKQY